MHTPFPSRPFLELFKKFLGAKQAPIFVFIWSFIVGILIAPNSAVKPLSSGLVVLIGFGFLLANWFLKHPQRKYLLCGLAFLGLGLGALRYQIKDFHQPDPFLESRVGSSLKIEGIVVSEPEHRDKDLRFVFQTATDRMLVSTNLYADVEYGDRLDVEGKLKVPGIIVDENYPAMAGRAGKEFDYAAFLSKDDIYYTMSFAHADIIGRGEGNVVVAALLKIKQNVVTKMKQILSEPESSLLAGLLVSGKQALPANIIEEFRNAGVIHIVVLSGYNITVVANFFLRIFAGLGLRLASGFSIFGIVLFTLMTGATATVVRASIMAILSVSGKLLGRNYSVGRALLAAAFLMLLQNPKILAFDPSFQLSFLATIAMIYVSPIVEQYLTWVSEKFQLRQIVSATVSTQLFVLPYLLYQIGSISIVSLFSNILILGFVPATMLLGFVSVLLSYLSTLIALPLTFVTHLLLGWILLVAKTLGGLSFASVSVSISFPAMLVLYFLMCALIIRCELNKDMLKQKRRR